MESEILYFIIVALFVYMHMCVQMSICLCVPSEARIGCHIPCNWSCRELETYGCLEPIWDL